MTPTSGRVLVTGGYSAGAVQSSVELYDPATGTWSTTGSLATPRSDHLSLQLTSTTSLVIGGLSGTGRFTGHASLASAEAFTASTASPAGTMSTPRHGHAIAPLSSGAVLVAGGLNKLGGSSTTLYLSSAELYQPGTHLWSPTASMLAVPVLEAQWCRVNRARSISRPRTLRGWPGSPGAAARGAAAGPRAWRRAPAPRHSLRQSPGPRR